MPLFQYKIKRPLRTFLLLAVGLFVAKALFVLVRGMTVQPDSYHYLVCVMNFDYPVGYPLFLRAALGMVYSLTFVGLCQALLFALGAAGMLVLICNRSKVAYVLGLLLALDPLSGVFCSSVLSEALFLPLLLLWIGILYQVVKHGHKSTMLLLGIVGALMYLTRFAALGILPFPVIFFLLRREHRKQVLWLLPLLLIGFQLTLLPVRLKYKQVFDTYSFSEFSGLTLWNNASVLWPGSQLQQNPQNDFERFMVERDFTAFDPQLAYDAKQISVLELPHRQYVLEKQRTFEEKPLINRELKETAMRLIRERPWDYVRLFVVGNYAKSFIQPDVAIEKHNFDYYSDEFGIDAHRATRYSNHVWTLLFLLLVIASVIYWKRERTRVGSLLTCFCWYYVLLFPAVAPMLLRYNIILAPFIMVALAYPLLKNHKKLNT